MKNLYFKILTFLNVVKSNIIFYPALLALLGFGLAFLMLFLEEKGISTKLIEILPQLVIENGDTALTILSVCIGGLISLMVFSFSMVMLLLSQASSNFSPRLLPGLISDKRHQFILGIYLATILYNIFILFAIEPSSEKYSLPGLSVLLGISFTIVCLIAFIYFIHNMSQSIQINNILDSIYDVAKQRLQLNIDNEAKSTLDAQFPDTDNWKVSKSIISGYFQNVALENIGKICKEQDLKIYITVPQGLYVLKNTCFIKSDKKLEKKTLDDIYSNISFSRGELISDNYILAFKQITEIAVKAMSPGVNDPGTAINAIDYLTELFALRMQKRDHQYYVNDKNLLIKIATIDFSELLYNVMASLRTYCKHDPIIVQKLIWMLQHLLNCSAANAKYKESIAKEAKTLINEALSAFNSERDREVLEALNGNF